MTHGLGRLPAPDPRDHAFLMAALLPPAPVTTTKRYWSQSGWWGDQGATSECVGYGWAHWLEDGPITQPGPGPIIHPDMIYAEAQGLDEFPGPPPAYDGTSVRAGAKVLTARGFITSYHWAFDLQTVVTALLTTGPVVVGTNWYDSMFAPDASGLIKIAGSVAGGHCYVLNGVNKVTGLVRIKNSWGRNWGRNGNAQIGLADLERLIRESGEACLAVEKRAGS